MKNALTAFMLAGATLFGIGLTSCQNEEMLPAAGNSAKEKVFVTLEATINNDMTRSTLEAAPFSLKFGWEKGDRLEVVNTETGEQIGYLYAEAPADPTQPGKCTLSGEVEKISKEVKLKFYYLGSKNYKLPVSKNEKGLYVANEFTYNFADQNGSNKELNENDLLCAEKNFPNGTVGSLGTIQFDHHFSVGRFKLVYEGDDLNFTNGTQVTISSATEDGKFYNASTLKPIDNTYNSNEGNIVVTTAKNDFYVYLVPSEKVTMKFTCTVDGLDFEGTLGSRISSGKFFTLNDAPIPVEMNRADGSDTRYDLQVIGYLNDGTEGTVEGTPVNTKLAYTYMFDGNLQDPKREGYEFKGWGLTSDATSAVESVSFSDPNETVKYVYAIWEQTTFEYTLIFKDSEGYVNVTKTISGASPLTVTISDYSADALAAFPDSYKESDHIYGWFIAEEGREYSNPDLTVTFSTDKTEITVVPVYKWTARFWDPILNKQIGARGNSAITTTKVLNGVFPSANDHTADGYKFLRWELNGEVVNDTNKKITLTTSEFEPTVMAVYEKIPYTLTITADLNYTGSQNPTYTWNNKTLPTDINLGTELVTPTRSGYDFKGWSLTSNGTTVDKVTFDDPSALNKTVYAIWEQLPDPNTVATPGYTNGTFAQ